MERGLRLKHLREMKLLSQTDASRYLGVSKQTLYKYENDIITNIPSDVIERMAALYETTPAYIMGWEPSDILQDTEVPTKAKIQNEKAEKAVEIYNQIMELPEKDQEELFSYLRYLQTKSDLPRSNS